MLSSTIAALATPPGNAGLAVIRISGPKALEIIRALFVPAHAGKAFLPRYLMYGHLIYEGRTLDECMAVYMPGPHSYTREDVCEIQVHGGELVVDSVLKAVYAKGAIPAQPGEFTRRAFENGRLDLSQAEAVMQLISASGKLARDAALRQLEGGTLRFIRDAQEELLRLMAGVTAAIDYPEEISQEEAVGEITPALLSLAATLLSACDERSAQILEEGLRVVICGKPNAGKSSLLNALLMEDRAIVTDIPGTTRDLVSGSIHLDGIKVFLQDTAGIRDSQDAVERIGVERALKAIKSADLRLMVMDVDQKPDKEDEELLRLIAGMDNLYLLNKSDLMTSLHEDYFKNYDLPKEQTLRLSALTGEGLETLRKRIRAFAGQPGQTALTSARHMALAFKAAEAIIRAANAMKEDLPLDLAAVDLNEALAALGEITGDNFSERLLDEVFSTFCVGK